MSFSVANRAALVGVFGGSGSGKSSFVRAWLPTLVREWRRVVVIDPTGEYEDWAKGAFTVPELGAWLVTNHAGFAVVHGFTDDHRRRASEVLYMAGNVLVVADEHQRYGTASRYDVEYMGRIVEMGRRRGMGLVAVTQRPSMVPKDLVSMLRGVVAFRLTYDGDVRALENSLGAGEVAAIPSLPPLHFITAGEFPAPLPGIDPEGGTS